MPPIYQTSERSAFEKMLHVLWSLRERSSRLLAANGDGLMSPSKAFTMVGLSLTVLCLVGVAEAGTMRSHGGVSQSPVLYKTASLLFKVCQNLPRHVHEAILSLCTRRTERETPQPRPEPLDMTVIEHVGSCQCEAVTFQVSSFFHNFAVAEGVLSHSPAHV